MSYMYAGGATCGCVGGWGRAVQVVCPGIVQSDGGIEAAQLAIVAQNYYNIGEHQKAYLYYPQAISLGDIESLLAIGTMIDKGLIKKNEQRNSLPLYLRAANLGSAHAMQILSFKYYFGKDVFLDIGEAVGWWTKMVKLSDKEVSVRLNIADFIRFYDDVYPNKEREGTKNWFYISLIGCWYYFPYVSVYYDEKNLRKAKQYTKRTRKK